MAGACLFEFIDWSWSRKPRFKKLNHGWNGEPNSPEPTIEVDGNDIILQFYVHPFAYSDFEEEELGILRFKACEKYRLGSTNDEGWYRGQCRFSKLAPEWGEFYEVGGDPVLLGAPADWKIIKGPDVTSKHFLFYLRDETFECVAADWLFEKCDNNALRRISRKTT